LKSFILYRKKLLIYSIGSNFIKFRGQTINLKQGVKIIFLNCIESERKYINKCNFSTFVYSFILSNIFFTFLPVTCAN